MLGSMNIGTVNADVPLYACPAVKSRTALTVRMCNRSGTAVTIRLAITGAVNTGPAADGSNYLECDTLIQPNTSAEFTGLVLLTNQAVFVRSNTINAVSAVAYGIEE